MVFLGLGTVMDRAEIGLLAGIGIVIIPTCILVYQAMAYPKYYKQEETIVENFKEWNHQGTHNKAVRGAVSSILWTLCLIIYFPLSFSTGDWHITWVLFLVCACIEGVVTLLFCLKSDKRN